MVDPAIGDQIMATPAISGRTSSLDFAGYAAVRSVRYLHHVRYVVDLLGFTGNVGLAGFASWSGYSGLVVGGFGHWRWTAEQGAGDFSAYRTGNANDGGMGALRCFAVFSLGCWLVARDCSWIVDCLGLGLAGSHCGW